MDIKKVVVLGGGVLGSQIAYQVAFCGFEVVMWLRSEGSITRAKPKLVELKEKYDAAIKQMAKDYGKTIHNWCNGISSYDEFDEEKLLKKNENILDKIKIELDLNKALKDCDLVIESTKEDLKEKRELFTRIAPVLEEKTIIVTNSSTLLPSKLAKYTGREEKFLSLHFANNIWVCNTAEVMSQPKTSDDAFNTVMEFATEIKMVALPLHKEKAGYLLNSMLVPLLFSALELYVNGISDPKSIDGAWKIGTGAPKGPFEILDIVGLKTAYNITLMYVKIPSFLSPYNFKGIAKLLKSYIDQGKTGCEVKEGFYKYE